VSIPDSTVQISNVNTGANLTVAGRDYTLNEIVQNSDIDVELSVIADPLLRLGWDLETRNAWLQHRRKHLRDTLIPKPRSSFGGPLASFEHLMSTPSNHDEDLATFENRLNDHLKLCRTRLLDNLHKKVHETGKNRVWFAVRNASTEPLIRVELVAEFDAPDVRVLEYAPTTYPMPPAPKWPHFTVSMFTDHLADFAGMAGAHAPALRGPRMSVEQQGTTFRIHYWIGGIGPTRTATTPPITVIPGPTDQVPEPITIELVAYAENRNDVVRRSVALEVSSKGWLIGHLINPNY
jgi:hypothetical protein